MLSYKLRFFRLLNGLLLPLVALCQQCRCLHGLFKHTPKSSIASELPASCTDTGSSSSFGKEDGPSLPLITPPKVDKDETQDLAISDDDEVYISDFSTDQEESDESNMPELVKPTKKKEKPSTAPHAVFSFGAPLCWLETGLHLVAALFQDDIEPNTPLGRLVKKIRTPALAPIPESDPDFQALINAVDAESVLSKDYRERKPSDPSHVFDYLGNSNEICSFCFGVDGKYFDLLLKNKVARVDPHHNFLRISAYSFVKPFGTWKDISTIRTIHNPNFVYSEECNWFSPLTEDEEKIESAFFDLVAIVSNPGGHWRSHIKTEKGWYFIDFQKIIPETPQEYPHQGENLQSVYLFYKRRV